MHPLDPPLPKPPKEEESKEKKRRSLKNLALGDLIRKTDKEGTQRIPRSAVSAPPKAPSPTEKPREKTSPKISPTDKPRDKTPPRPSKVEKEKEKEERPVILKKSPTLAGSKLSARPKFASSYVSSPPPETPQEMQERLAVRSRAIHQFLEREENGILMRSSAGHHPVLADGKPEWRLTFSKPTEEQVRVHALCLKFILDLIEEAQQNGFSEFALNDGKAKNVFEFRMILANHPTTKECIAKSGTLLELWRKTFLLSTMPHTELRVLKKLAEAIKTIMEAFIRHQKNGIASLREQTVALSALDKLPTWTSSLRKKHLTHLYMRHMEDAAINEVLYKNTETIFVKSSYHSHFILNEFFHQAQIEADQYKVSVEPLLRDQPFQTYIERIEKKADRKEFQEHLKQESLSLIIAQAVGDKFSKWAQRKEKLAVALAELAERGLWLLEEWGVEEGKKLGIPEKNPKYLLPLEELVLKIAKAIGERKP